MSSAPRPGGIAKTLVLAGILTRLIPKVFKFRQVDILSSIPAYTTMAPPLSSLFLVLIQIANLVAGTALTYKLSPGEKSCFFTDVKQPGVKIAFYFAVNLQRQLFESRLAS